MAERKAKMDYVRTDSKSKYAKPTLDLSKHQKQEDSVNNMARSVINAVMRQAYAVISKENLLDKAKQKHRLDTESTEALTLTTPCSSHLNLQLASEFVDGILDESFRLIDERAKSKEKGLYTKTNHARLHDTSVFEAACSLVDGILGDSARRVTNLRLLGVDRFQRYSFLDEFTVRDGIELVARCIAKWTFNPNWYFNITYNGRMTGDTHVYFYTVKWSVPSLAYPVAQVSVDVYFSIEVTPMKPPPVDIQVWFRVETDRSQHSAFTTTFQESWLKAVLRFKLKTYHRFTF